MAATGRDLRLLVIVARLWTNENGLAGAAEGLKLITENVAQYWETLHPALRPSASPRSTRRTRRP